jgi:hypothetical protein
MHVYALQFLAGSSAPKPGDHAQHKLFSSPDKLTTFIVKHGGPDFSKDFPFRKFIVSKPEQHSFRYFGNNQSIIIDKKRVT